MEVCYVCSHCADLQRGEKVSEVVVIGVEWEGVNVSMYQATDGHEDAKP